MQSYIETLGRMISAQVAPHPRRARRMLTAAYSWVRFSGKCQRLTDAKSAYARMNGAVARSLVRGLRHPERAVCVNIFMPCEMLHAMGLTPMFPEGLSVYVACTACQHVFAERAEVSGIPESFCSYHKTMLGMAETGVLPKPLMIAGTTLACDANQLSFRRLAALYPAPLTIIDVPGHADDDAVAYVADQLRGMTRRLEALTGRKLDEAKLRESMACADRTLKLMREYAALRAEVTQDTTMTGELCSLIATHCLLGHADGENYVRELIETARRAPDAGADPLRRRLRRVHGQDVFQRGVLRRLPESLERASAARAVYRGARRARQPPAPRPDSLRIPHPGGKPDMQRPADAGRPAGGSRRLLLRGADGLVRGRAPSPNALHAHDGYRVAPRAV